MQCTLHTMNGNINTVEGGCIYTMKVQNEKDNDFIKSGFTASLRCSKMFKVAALYHFTTIDDCNELGDSLRKISSQLDILGGIIIANEGINGTISGLESNLDRFMSNLREDIRFSGIDVKYSFSANCPFYRMRIRIRPEIIRMGVPDANQCLQRGFDVEPQEWNSLISSKDVLLLDTRNDYEVDIGTFRGAVNPRTKQFTEFPEFIKTNMETLKDKKIAMFCTGGIRCEKASAFLRLQGFDNVYQLKGGIIKYLEVIPPEESTWEGECYIFDQRISLKHGLQVGEYLKCWGCRHTLTDEDTHHHDYLDGVHCPYCIHHQTEAIRAANAERNRQMSLAKLRNERHIGLKFEISKRHQLKNQIMTGNETAS